MDPFSWINPCGLTGVQMTSMQEVLGREIVMEEVRSATKLHIREIFGVELKQTEVNDIYKILGKNLFSRKGAKEREEKNR